MNVAEIDKLKSQVELDTNLQLQIINAEKRKATMLIEANNIREMAEL